MTTTTKKAYRDGFPVMPDIVPEGTHGEASVTHYQITELDAARDSWRGIRTFPEKVAILRTRRGTEMSDTYHERSSNWEALTMARGDVLIAGLGLGMLVHPIIEKPEVTSVTVVEVNPDVIALISPTLPPGVTVVQGDIFTWAPPPGQKFDTIYFDIWPNITGDSWSDMKALTTRARSWRRRKAWVGCWLKDEVRGLYRR